LNAYRLLAGLVATLVGALGYVIAGAAPLEQAAPGDAVRRGDQLFHSYCSRCHGVDADGKSPLAALLSTRPSNLRRSVLSRADKERMVRLGGAVNSRSPIMPSWQNELSRTQINDILDYLQSIRESKP